MNGLPSSLPCHPSVRERAAVAGQAPFGQSAPDFLLGGRDRVHAAEFRSVITLRDPQPANLAPLYRGRVLVHGLGFSPDRKTLAVVSIASTSVTFIDMATNEVKHTTYVGRAPHEPFFTHLPREIAHHRPQRARHDDLLFRLCVIELHPGDRDGRHQISWPLPAILRSSPRTPSAVSAPRRRRGVFR
jgi:hypothetical protein